MNQFWMVYVEGGNTPAKKHVSYSDAVKESERLCATIGKRCYILQSLTYCERSQPPLAWRVMTNVA